MFVRLPKSLRLRDRYFIAAALVIQALCAGFFIADMLSSTIGLRATPIPWQAREIIEIGAGFGLLLGIVLGAVALRRSRSRHLAAEAKLRVASTAFMDLLAEYFDEWSLTPAERDVALFVVKGLSTADIAALRTTSEGTVKAQTNAIYRKAGVSSRAQLLSVFIDGLMEEQLVPGDGMRLGMRSDTGEAGRTTVQ
ncbi:helix-turn-helix transcriptional regulator [Maritimibacter sp. DP1N21-5]|uniref:helix-turn-helix transcriptional regulator n=1 Tax=Maritimibacter sp. DP1N21-5 TaxID=2836867 RepID=UPI001C45F99D|nr:helix-turn-helix transcriptional regulator [Maritimibacter sp. DP1N21-5]MBV7408651.1 LuxR C-terminal-related transcriptional regulator [Maritimibacter sp. DP1N21-5]